MAERPNPIELLVIYAIDLLSQTEAQHRAICRTQLRLDTLRGAEENRAKTDTLSRRKTLTTVGRDVKELLAVVHSQRRLLEEMGHAVTLLKASSTSSI